MILVIKHIFIYILAEEANTYMQHVSSLCANSLVRGHYCLIASWGETEPSFRCSMLDVRRRQLLQSHNPSACVDSSNPQDKRGFHYENRSATTRRSGMIGLREKRGGGVEAKPAPPCSRIQTAQERVHPSGPPSPRKFVSYRDPFFSQIICRGGFWSWL